MFAQAAQRSFRGARAPLSVWAQPSEQLHASAQLPRVAQTDAARIPSRSNSVLTSRQIAPGPRYPLPQRPLASFPFLRSTRRPFSSGPRSRYQYNPYNRFNGPRRGSLFYTLIQNSKPRHFVVIGLGIWGVWLYNTDVVTVKKTPNQKTWKDSRRYLTISSLGVGNRPPALHLRFAPAGARVRRRGIPRGAPRGAGQDPAGLSSAVAHGGSCVAAADPGGSHPGG